MNTRICRNILRASLAVLMLAAGCEITNNPPTISIVVPDNPALTGSTQTISAIVDDPDENAIVRISWSVTGGTLDNTKGEEVMWTAPYEIGEVTIRAVADDGIPNGIDSTNCLIQVINNVPVITSFTSSSPYALMGNSVELTVTATEPDGEELSYFFSSLTPKLGEFAYSDPTSPTTTWYAPKWEDSNFSRSYKLVARVSDEQGYSAWDTLSVLVYSEAGTIWVVDSEYATVKKYTAEGDFVLASDHNFTEPRAVASDVKRDYGCYVADYGADEVIKLNHLGEFKARYPNLPNVTDVALHEPSHTLWAINEGDGTLAVFYNHTPDVPAKTVSGFHSPNAITINQSSGDVWVADVGNNTVVQLNAVFLNDLPSDLSSGNVTIFGDTSATYNFNVPAWLSVRDQVGGTLYIADNKHGEVERLTYNSSSETYFRDTAVSGFETPSRVVATRKGEVWVLSDAGTIQYFDEDNVTLAPTAIFSYTFVDPHAMAADDNTGDVWVGDNGTHQIVRIVSPDSLAATISGINYVADIVVNR